MQAWLSHSHSIGLTTCRDAYLPSGSDPWITRSCLTGHTHLMTLTWRTHSPRSELIAVRLKPLRRSGAGGSADRGGVLGLSAFSYSPSSRLSAAGSAPATSTTFVRLDAPATSVTA